jgi:hypothetical protein
MARTYQIERRYTQAAARPRKRIYDTRVKMAEFTAGKFVWVYYPRAWKRRSQKRTSYYTHPLGEERRNNPLINVVKKFIFLKADGSTCR